MVNYLKKIYKKDPETICRMIDNELVVVPLGEDVDVKDLGFFYILKNKTATYIWELIDGEKSVEQIKEAIIKRFQVKPKKAESDILSFLNELKDIKAIV